MWLLKNSLWKTNVGSGGQVTYWEGTVVSHSTPLLLEAPTLQIFLSNFSFFPLSLPPIPLLPPFSSTTYSEEVLISTTTMTRWWCLLGTCPMHVAHLETIEVVPHSKTCCQKSVPKIIKKTRQKNAGLQICLSSVEITSIMNGSQICKRWMEWSELYQRIKKISNFGLNT